MRNAIEIAPVGRNMRFFEFASRMARISDYGKFNHGAVLVRHGSVLNASCNKNKSCSFGERFRERNIGLATLHAELGAILNMGRENTANSDVYVVRTNIFGEFRNSRPCLMCQEAMKFVGVKRVFYSSGHNQFEMMKL